MCRTRVNKRRKKKKKKKKKNKKKKKKKKKKKTISYKSKLGHISLEKHHIS